MLAGAMGKENMKLNVAMKSSLDIERDRLLKK